MIANTNFIAKLHCVYCGTYPVIVVNHICLNCINKISQRKENYCPECEEEKHTVEDRITADGHILYSCENCFSIAEVGMETNYWRARDEGLL